MRIDRPLRAPAPMIARPRLTGYEAHRVIAGLRRQRGEWFVIGIICGAAAAFVVLERLGRFLG